MNTTNTASSVSRLTSAEDEGKTPEPLRRALWLQARALRGLQLSARDLAIQDNQVQNQQALCTELQRITTEAVNLLRELEAAEVA